MSRFWTPFSHSREGSPIYRIFGWELVTVLSLLLLSSCGFSIGDSTSNSPAKNSEIAGTPALTDPPDKNARPGEPTGPLQPARGVNTSLFAEELRSDDARLDRLETAVQSLRNDFDTMQPAITRLVGIEDDIQELVVQLEALLEDETAPPAASAAAPLPGRNQRPMADSPPPGPETEMAEADDEPLDLMPAQEEARYEPPPVQKPPAVDPLPKGVTGKAILDIRTGEHPDKTRIVLDANNKPSFTHDLDNMEKILIVELPQTSWNAAAQEAFRNSPILASYKTSEISTGGTRLIIQLKKPVQVMKTNTIDGPGAGRSRLIIDLKEDVQGVPTQ